MMVLMGTKLDIVEAIEAKRQVTLEEARSMAAVKHLAGAIETSAKADKNISETFFDLATKLKEKHERLAIVAEAEKSVKLSSVAVKDDTRRCPC